MSCLLGLGRQAEELKPEIFRAAVANKAQTAAKAYAEGVKRLVSFFVVPKWAKAQRGS